MKRGLYLSEADGKQVIVSLAEVTMADDAAAAELKALADTDGTGNANDLLREGGAPAGLPNEEVFASSQYAASVDGSVVRIALAAYVDGGDPTDAVEQVAKAALKVQID